jgi:hypothetical protein
MSQPMADPAFTGPPGLADFCVLRLGQRTKTVAEDDELVIR